jgi:hypothetical protein
MNTSVKFNLTLKQVEECSRELAKLHNQSTAAFFRTPKGVAAIRGAIAILFILFVAVPLVAVLGTEVKFERWFIIYFSIASWLLGTLSASITIQPIDADVPGSLLFTKGIREFRIAEYGLECKLNDTTSSTPWSSFSTVFFSANFLILAKKDGQFNAIPLTGFPTRQAADDFAIELSKRIKSN